MWLTYARAALPVAVVSAAFAAGWFVNGLRCETARLQVQVEADRRIQAGMAAAQRVHQKALEGYREDLNTVANRPPQPVIVRSPAAPRADLPATPGGAAGASGSGADRPADVDIGPDIARCRDELYRLRALINAVQPQ